MPRRTLASRTLVFFLLLLCSASSLVSAQGQLINGARTLAGGLNYGIATGAANTYALALDPAITLYIPGTCFAFKANAANTGSASLNVNGLGPKTIQKWVSGTLTNLASSDIGLNQIVSVCYDGTQMQVQSGSGGSGGGGAGDITAVGSCVTGDCFTAGVPSQTLLFQTIAAPTQPSAGTGILYVDNTSLNIAVKDPAGVVRHGARTKAVVASQFLTGMDDTGLFTGAQVAVTDLANIATATILGRATAGTGAPEVLSAAQARTILDAPTLSGTNVWTGGQDATGATRTAPFKVVNSLPVNCVKNDVYWLDPASLPGQNLWGCTAANVLTLIGDGNAAAAGTMTSSTIGNVARYTANGQVIGGSSGLILSATSLDGRKDTITTLTTNTTLAVHNLINCDTTSGTVTLTLPAANSTTVGHYTIIKTVAANTCSLARGGSDLLNGLAGPIVLTAQWDRIDVDLNNTANPGNWSVVTAKAQKGYLHLPVQAAKLPTTNAAIIDQSESRPKLLFDTSLSWCASWTAQLNPDFGSSPVLVFGYSMTSATSGGIAMDWSVWKTTSAEAVDAETESYDAANTCVDATVPASAGRMKQIACTLTNFDTAVADDLITIKACRNVANASDNAPGNLELLSARLQYIKN